MVHWEDFSSNNLVFSVQQHISYNQQFQKSAQVLSFSQFRKIQKIITARYFTLPVTNLLTRKLTLANSSNPVSEVKKCPRVEEFGKHWAEMVVTRKHNHVLAVAASWLVSVKATGFVTCLSLSRAVADAGGCGPEMTPSTSRSREIRAACAFAHAYVRSVCWPPTPHSTPPLTNFWQTRQCCLPTKFAWA